MQDAERDVFIKQVTLWVKQFVEEKILPMFSESEIRKCNDGTAMYEIVAPLSLNEWFGCDDGTYPIWDYDDANWTKREFTVMSETISTYMRGNGWELGYPCIIAPYVRLYNDYDEEVMQAEEEEISLQDMLFG